MVYIQKISRALFRGYIGDMHLQQIDGCRKNWNDFALSSTKALYNNLYIQHKITYRLYRSWEDFEDYHISGLNKIKGVVV